MATATETSAIVYSSRPTVFLDGEPQGDLGEGSVLSMLVEEGPEGLARCELRLENWGTVERRTDFLHLDRERLEFGATLGLEIGSPATRRPIFEGRISALEAQLPSGRAPELIVLAEDRFQDLRMTRRTRTFEDLSDRQIFETVAADHSLNPDVAVDGVTHRLVAQVAETDLALLRRRANAIGAELWIEGDKLHVDTRANRDPGTVELTYGRNLVAATLTADVSHQRSSVTGTGWSVDRKCGIAVEGTDSILRGELEGDSGPSTLDETLAPRPEILALSGSVTEDEARLLADARHARRARRFLSGRIEVDGEAALRVGTRVELALVGKLFNGTWTVVGVRHTFEEGRGYRTTAEIERAWIGAAS